MCASKFSSTPTVCNVGYLLRGRPVQNLKSTIGVLPIKYSDWRSVGQKGKHDESEYRVGYSENGVLLKEEEVVEIRTIGYVVTAPCNIWASVQKLLFQYVLHVFYSILFCLCAYKIQFCHFAKITIWIVALMEIFS